MDFAELLLRWYDQHARVLPWRGIHNAYHTWVSETMLQQTRVETVLAYFERFIRRFPTVEALAAAPEDEVLKLWEGLGYYRRARNLHKGAQQVVAEHGGVIPRDVKELMKISGIGEYTAGAIASIAYEQAVPAVDGNVIRVVSRVKGIRENVGIPSVKRRIAQEAAALVPENRPGDFNQAMMDLGATICVPGTPSCERCPVAALCDAYREGDAEDIPELPRKNPPRVIDYDLCLIFNGNRVLMRQRTETMLQGLWVYPMVEEHHTAKQLPALVKRKIGLPVTDIQPAGEAKHIFTHQVWQMKLYIMQTTAEAPAGWRFVTGAEMEKLTIPTAVRKALVVVRKVMEEQNENTV
ncbi:MAG: A/G-specific adenine glycosylase [Oscillospiraceae bacterium]|nr:A/G-specific adenine glycosylase [Clostridia bacterium]MBQ9149268.1 A/G-specific adenine glycosylase [Oscillospiraceae bacterium]